MYSQDNIRHTTLMLRVYRITPFSAFLFYPWMWAIVSFDARSDVIDQGPERITAAVDALHAAQAKEVAKLIADEHRAEVAAVKKAVAESPAAAVSSANEERDIARRVQNCRFKS